MQKWAQHVILPATLQCAAIDLGHDRDRQRLAQDSAYRKSILHDDYKALEWWRRIYAAVKAKPHDQDAYCNRTLRNEAGVVLFFYFKATNANPGQGGMVQSVAPYPVHL